MTDLPEGLYETLVDGVLAGELASLSPDLVADEPLSDADAADRVALFLSREVERALEAVPERDRSTIGVAVLESLISRLEENTAIRGMALRRPVRPGRVLRAVRDRRPDGEPEVVRLPLIPLLDTALLTNSPGEPGVGSQIRTEIESADRIDLVMAFIRVSGIRPLLTELAAHCRKGRRLRVLTTTYTGSTEPAALAMLEEIGAEVRVSYDSGATRLHAKSWLFHRRSGFSTAYIGSSNLTHSAQVTGLEWNVRVSRARNRSMIDKISAVFDSYWQSGDFAPFHVDEFRARTGLQPGGTITPLSPIEVTLRPFQERLLEQIELARTRGHHRNVLAAATGTGKTVMAAVDFARLKATLPQSRLLFVAHREEILDQSLATFRHVLRDGSFGEKWVGRYRPTRFEHVFASIQSLHAADLSSLDPHHFDVVVIDEFHHAAAPTYRALVEQVEPRELLGLTATPERSDGQDILSWFGGRIAAELRLWDAIDQQYLVPFAYYGVHDNTDLTAVSWRRGTGYDLGELSKVYTGHQVRANLVIKELLDKMGGVEDVRALGFCVSVEHAHFMAEHFTAHGIPALALSGTSSADERLSAPQRLRSGEVRVIFAVDLYNEGVDLPDVNTILMLRPTESPTLFLQQLGRGLRRAQGKSLCTVLDFIGNHRREFRFDRRYRALLGGGRKDLEKAIRGGFPFLPAGAHMQLDPVAEATVLRSVREAIPSRRSAIVSELAAFARTHKGDVELADFLIESGLELEDLYSSNFGWSDLYEQAGFGVRKAGPHEGTLRRAVGRMLHMDDATRLVTYRRLVAEESPPRVSELSKYERRLARMLISDLGPGVVSKNSSVQDAIDTLWEHPQILVEIRQLLPVLEDRIAHVNRPISLPGVPLVVHARYRRGEILAALGEGDRAMTPPWREGVFQAKRAAADVFAFTLDKTSGAFSPTTRYRDYAITRDLIHWESQSTTRASSPVGLRYQQHGARGHSILLFARERQDQRAFYFLGSASYVSHEGEMPMAITWRLHTPLPGDLYEAFAAAVA